MVVQGINFESWNSPTCQYVLLKIRAHRATSTSTHTVHDGSNPTQLVPYTISTVDWQHPDRRQNSGRRKRGRFAHASRGLQRLWLWTDVGCAYRQSLGLLPSIMTIVPVVGSSVASVFHAGHQALLCLTCSSPKLLQDGRVATSTHWLPCHRSHVATLGSEMSILAGKICALPTSMVPIEAVCSLNIDMAKTQV